MSVCHLFSIYFQVIVKLNKPNQEAQIYFVFLCVGSPNHPQRRLRGLERRKLFCKLWSCDGLCGLQMCLRLCVGF